MYRFDGSTVLIIKTDVTYTVTHQTTHILPPAGSQNALDESHKKASAQKPLLGQASSLDAGERMSHEVDGGVANITDDDRPLA